MKYAEKRAAVRTSEARDDSTGAGQPSVRPSAPPGYPEIATPKRTIPWLTESSPQTWDSYAKNGGPDYLIADCGSPKSHEQRLKAILRLPVKEGDTILEFGCGTGRLADLLPRSVRYEGLDWSPGVITQAQHRRPHNAFRCGTVSDLTAHDWVVASGPFNYARGWSKNQTAEALAAMWSASRRGVALTALRIPADGRLHYSAEELASFLAACDWSHLELDRSYLPNDMCLRAWREA